MSNAAKAETLEGAAFATQVEQALKTGDIKAALALCQQELARNPGNAQALNYTGVIAYKAQNLPTAVKFLEQAVRAAPREGGFHANLALVYAAQGRKNDAAAMWLKAGTLFTQSHKATGQRVLLEQALQALAKAQELTPKETGVWLALAQTHVARGDIPAVENALERVLELNPGNTHAMEALANIYEQSGNYPRAITLLERLLAADGASKPLRQRLFSTCYAYGAMEKAVTLCEEYIKRWPEDTHGHSCLIMVLNNMNLHERAEAALAEAEKRFGKHVDLLQSYATIARRQGRLDEAETLLRAYLAENPESHFVAWAELNKVLHQQKRYDEAHQAQVRGQHVAKAMAAARQMRFDEALAAVSVSKRWVNADHVRNWRQESPPHERKPPMFMVGFPRSGTTLAEQVLSAHPDVLGTAEALILNEVGKRAGKLLGRACHFPAVLPELNAEEIRILRGYYWQVADEMFAQQAAQPSKDTRVLDKQPLNIIHLPMLNRLFAESPVMVMIRDPRDVVLSCFRQAFIPNVFTIHFHSLESAANLYAETMGLWLRYRETLTLPMKEFRYEDMVADLEGTARAMLDFAGLPWDAEVLRYYAEDKNRYVRTPSLEGVMKPVYKDAAGGWKKYEKYMKPVLPILEPFVKEWGYA